MPKGAKQGRYCFTSCRRCIALSEDTDQWRLMHEAIMAVSLAIAVSNYQKGDRSLLTNDQEYRQAEQAVVVAWSMAPGSNLL
jgi:hypothetical protein